jgi:uncharacterized protein (DUF983 family)
MSEDSNIGTGLRRGLALRCPNCGEGRLFAGFLKVSPHCEGCGADNTVHPADDAPPYLTLMIVGHVVLPVMFWADRAFAPALWLHFAIWLPLVATAAVALLPFTKGAVIGLAWATGVRR